MKDSDSQLCLTQDNLPEDSEDPAQRYRQGAALAYNHITRSLKEA